VKRYDDVTLDAGAAGGDQLAQGVLAELPNCSTTSAE